VPQRDRLGVGVCRGYSDRLAGVADAEVSDLELRRHVRSCGLCRRKLTEYAQVRAVLHSARPQALTLLEAERSRFGPRFGPRFSPWFGPRFDQWQGTRPEWVRVFTAPGSSVVAWFSTRGRRRT
jgi:hypothetical protein